MHYPVQRSFHLSTSYKLLFGACFPLAFFIVTLVTLAASGYETAVVTSSDFNATNPLWYDRFLPTSIRSPHRNCTAGDLNMQTAGLYTYQFAASSSVAHNPAAYGHVPYSNNEFRGASVQNMAYVSFNDSAGIYYGLTMYQSWGGSDNSDWIASALQNATDIESVSQVWARAARLVFTSILAPNGLGNSIFRSTLIAEGWEILSFDYYDYYPATSQFNTPANDHWSVRLWAVFENKTVVSRDQIYFTTNGDIDLTRTNLTNANNKLYRVQTELTDKAPPNVEVDFWRLLNWIYVVQYWTLLYDLGQVQPTLYEHNGTFPNSFQPYEFAATNNIFINASLFQVYNDYFESTILPLLGISNAGLNIRPPTPTNRLYPRSVTFEMAYLCRVTQLKHWLTLLIAVAVGDYTILHSSYGVLIFFLTKWHQNKKWNDGMGTALAPEVWVTVGNWCEGCVLQQGKEIQNMDDATKQSHYYQMRNQVD